MAVLILGTIRAVEPRRAIVMDLDVARRPPVVANLEEVGRSTRRVELVTPRRIPTPDRRRSTSSYAAIRHLGLHPAFTEKEGL